MTTDDTPPMASVRMAAGALFTDDAGAVLLVKPTYKKGWDIPGGYVEPGESPEAACVREVKEELGIDWQPGPLLVIDWAPQDGLGDKVLWVFDGGRLNPETPIRLQASELGQYRYWAPNALADALPERLYRRITSALKAKQNGQTTYLERGIRHD
jgi:ADP-ribose pyrophosphatase YjhB (NUDIX family)